MTTPHNQAQNGQFARRYGPRDWPASAEVEALEDAESHFTPPQPPRVRLSFADPVRFWVLVGALLGPIGAIVALVFRAALGPSALLTGLLWFLGVLFVASLLVLLTKMPRHHADTHENNDGAVL